MPRVGVLALQGDFAAHGRALDDLGVEWRLVKTPSDLAQVQGLIIPGGESTTLLKLMAPIAMRPALEQFHAEERPIFGTCAGLILLAQETIRPQQESLGFINIVAERNAYGRQIDSFIDLGTRWCRTWVRCRSKWSLFVLPRLPNCVTVSQRWPCGKTKSC
jgi:5'-phosphate synthase pdxT subunit